MEDNKFLIIDGSFGEGGGAILRLGAGFSILYNQKIKIENIRANRSNPGLRLQHLLGLQLITKLTGSALNECDIGSEEITLIPKFNIKKNLQVNINTAANIGLLLQPIQVVSLGLPKNIKIDINLNGGGTFGKWAPSLNYLKHVTYKLFNKAGLKIDVDIKRHGFYPKGGALVDCKIFTPKYNLKPINLTDLGVINLINGEIICTKSLKRTNVAERIEQSIKKYIKKNLNIESEVIINYVDSYSNGVGLSLWAESDIGAIISSGTILGEKGISSEEIGKKAAKTIIEYIKNEIPVDNYLSDQLIPLIAYNKEESTLKVLKITSHTKTNLDLVKLFTNRSYEIIKENNSSIIKYHSL